MRRIGNLFGKDDYRGEGRSILSVQQMVTLILSALSVLGIVIIIANFGKLTAQIAIGIVNILSGGLPILVVIMLIAILIMRLRCRNRRRFWD